MQLAQFRFVLHELQPIPPQKNENSNPKSLKSMTEESSNTELTAGELETISGCMTTKIGASNPKKPCQKPRARVKEESQVPQYVAKVYKKAAQIADLMTGEDVEADLKVLRDAKKACHQVYDVKKGKLVKVPDHKTRLAATTLSRAYHEGKPVERSIAAHADVQDFPSLIAKLNQSPAFQALEDSSEKTMEGKEILPALPAPEV
jgi:hypothetical protein